MPFLTTHPQSVPSYTGLCHCPLFRHPQWTGITVLLSGLQTITVDSKVSANHNTYHCTTALLNEYLLILYISKDQRQVKHTMVFAEISLTFYAFFLAAFSEELPYGLLLTCFRKSSFVVLRTGWEGRCTGLWGWDSSVTPYTDWEEPRNKHKGLQHFSAM